MVTLTEAIILSIIQGITEWLPISSSGHLAIVQLLLGIEGLSFPIFLHFASILAVIILFWKDILTLGTKEKRYYLFLLILALLPALIAGLLLRSLVENIFTNPTILGIIFIISGITIYGTKYAREKNNKLSPSNTLLIGCMQAFAIIPGISRSGFTIAGGLFAGISKKEAIRFSFLLAIPIILGAALIDLPNLSTANISGMVLVLSFMTTLLVSLVTIQLLISIIQHGKFHWFGLYNILLGILIVLITLL